MKDSQLNNAFNSVNVPEFSPAKRRQAVEQAESLYIQVSASLKESQRRQRPIDNEKSKWTMFRSLFMKQTANFGGMVAMSLIALTVGYSVFQATTVENIYLPQTDTVEFETMSGSEPVQELAEVQPAEEQSPGQTDFMTDSASGPLSVKQRANKQGSVSTAQSYMDESEPAQHQQMPSAALLSAADMAETSPGPGNRNQFSDVQINSVKQTVNDPISTFSIDTDTASYSYVRRQLQSGRLPDPDAVRIEEMVNYFDYNYPLSTDRDVPFTATSRIVPSPWNSNNKLLHIGIRAFETQPTSSIKSNLVFLVDTSGSMQAEDKLPLLISSFRLLLDTLSDDDSVAIVTYAGQAGVLLQPTDVKHRQVILEALQSLSAGGSTAGQAGIRQAYALAEQHYQQDAVNRVFLATDGDFNVGISDPGELKSFIEKKRDTGVFLSILGFGDGNYNDVLMQTLAQNGNGQAYYIDTLNEAQKVLVDESTSTLFPVASDVKIQIEFNPRVVAEYRLIGYETRHLNTRDFNNDKIDAAEIGTGHTVTAIYEITPVEAMQKQIDEPRYSGNKVEPVAAGDFDNEYAYLKIRYKQPGSETSQKIATAITRNQQLKSLDQASSDVRFAIAVCAFGQLLKQSADINDLTYQDVISLAQASKGEDNFGYRSEFIRLAKLAKSLSQHD